MSRRLLVPALATVAFASSAAVATASGPGLLARSGMAAFDGVTTASSPYRYVSLYAGNRTVVAKIARDGGRVLATLYDRRPFTVPAVADDGSGTGLSADGNTLVLAVQHFRFPQSTTSFAVVGTARMRIAQRLALRGEFSLDAVSPDGKVLYLIQYQSVRNPLRYAVRAYEVATRTLDPKPIVDPREPDEAMRGYPVTRAMSGDGRWAYTLYQGGEHPFIHALDTVGRTARCIDLPAGTELRGDPASLDLRIDRTGRRLTVVDAGEPSVVVDTRTFRARVAPVIPYRPAAEKKPDDGGPSPALMGGTGLGVLLLAGAGAVARRRRRTG
jgi:hypothetical protein